jgi:hypothetical protein
MAAKEKKQRFWAALADCLEIWPVEARRYHAWKSDALAIEHDWLMVGGYLRNACNSWSIDSQHSWPAQLSLFGSDYERRGTTERSDREPTQYFRPTKSSS